MDPAAAHLELISGLRTGLIATGTRAALHGASWIYRGLIAVRNAWYDRFALPIWLDVPVISVGNLTVGGTGKTPMTIWICRRLLERGIKPTVLSRGYKASQEGVADELLVISRQVPGAVAVANPDRAAAGRLAVAEYHVQAAVLDDGFQHRRLGRDLDLVLIDAAQPFGFGYVLPRGLLREPVQGLRRAAAIVVTHADRCPPAARAELEAAIRRHNPQAPIVYAVHRPAGFTDLAGNTIQPPTGTRIGSFAAIARPDGFAHTLTGIGIAPVATKAWPDHHLYQPADLEAIRTWVRAERLDALVTTEKDAVKLASLQADWPVPIYALRIEIDILDGGDRILGDLIDRMLREHKNAEEPQHTSPA